MVKTYPNLEAFVVGFPRFSKMLTTGLVVELHREVHQQGRKLLRAEIPVGETGAMRNSLRDSTSGGFVHPDELREPGKTRIISIDAGWHAADHPRRLSKPYRRGRQAGMRRILGTRSAPRGFTTPAVEKLTGRFRVARMQAEAFRRAWRRAS